MALSYSGPVRSFPTGKRAPAVGSAFLGSDILTFGKT